MLICGLMSAYLLKDVLLFYIFVFFMDYYKTSYILEERLDYIEIIKIIIS